ncbi:hypothetical protein DSO57_1011228 [Entomophthora muscae]|uniref:Uncharacterized protein n=1 Tax=Entomophthora muscae TaxID=34485 RepID=A0ACC2S8B8_9FUNG|nr:hypothetical protein DSO57_1011228 [Entomophthora muscae]
MYYNGEIKSQTQAPNNPQLRILFVRRGGRPHTPTQEFRHPQDTEMDMDSTQTPQEETRTPNINPGEAMETNPP